MDATESSRMAEISVHLNSRQQNCSCPLTTQDPVATGPKMNQFGAPAPVFIL